MKTKCERAGSLLILIGMLMLTACAALLFYNTRESKQAENGASQRLSAVKAFLGSSSVQDHSGKPDTQTVPAPDGSYSLPEQPECFLSLQQPDERHDPAWRDEHWKERL